MNTMDYCQLCDSEVDGTEKVVHSLCAQLETMRNNYSIILPFKTGDGDWDMTRKRDSLYVWVTWLSQLIAGERSCQWAVWFKTHFTGYDKVPSDFQLAVWTVQHTQMLDKLAKEHSTLGETILREDQNSLKVRRSSGLVIAGRPDLVTINQKGQYAVYDAKTGAPSNKHTIQVMLYMMLLPYSQVEYRGKEFAGCVVYRNGQQCDVPAAAINDDFTNQVTYFLSILESAIAPEPTPSFEGCKFCDITTNDCPARIQINIPRFVDGAEPEIPF